MKYNYKLPIITKLKELYVDNKLSTKKLAVMFGVTSSAVKNKLNRYGIKLRTFSEAQKGNTNTLGYKYSKSHNKRQSILFKKLGITPPSRKGCKLTEEHKEKIGFAQLGEKSNNWRGGISFEPYPTIWTKKLKRSILKRDHYTCQLCYKYGNVCHHIDYNKQNCEPNNLITLCFSCNAKVNFKRKYWEIFFTNFIKRRKNAT